MRERVSSALNGRFASEATTRPSEPGATPSQSSPTGAAPGALVFTAVESAPRSATTASPDCAGHAIDDRGDPDVDVLAADDERERAADTARERAERRRDGNARRVVVGGLPRAHERVALGRDRVGRANRPS